MAPWVLAVALFSLAGCPSLSFSVRVATSCCFSVHTVLFAHVLQMVPSSSAFYLAFEEKGNSSFLPLFKEFHITPVQ